MAGKEQTVANIISALLPAVVELIKVAFAAQHPDQPAPTSAEVLATFNATVIKSLAADDAWLSQHPKVV